MTAQTKPRVTEAHVTKQIRDYLKLKGILHWKNFSTLGSIPGIPDILGVMKGGRMLAIEVKAPNGRVSAEQRAFIDALVEAGALAFVAKDADDLIGRGI